MLSAYYNKTAVNSLRALDVKYTDTASMLSPYARSLSLGAYVPYTGATSNLNLGTYNYYGNNYFNGFTSVAASGTLITLTTSSTPSYLITGSGGQTIQLPNATTLPNGAIYYFNNNQTTGAISVNNNSTTLVKSVPSGAYLALTLIDNSTAAGSWDAHFEAPSNVSWSTNTLDYAGSITSATWNGTAVAILRGGTGASTAATALSNLGGLAKSDTATMLSPYLRGVGYGLSSTSQFVSSDTTKLIPYTDTLKNYGMASQYYVLTHSGTYSAGRGLNLTGSSFSLDTSKSYTWNPSVTAASAIARGSYYTPSLTAAANNDVLVGLEINTTFTNGAFTGVKNIPARINGATVGSITDNYSVALGYQALYANTGTLGANVAVGYQALLKQTTGYFNTAIGSSVLNNLTTGNSNIAVGSSALQYGNNSNNVAIGRSAGGGASYNANNNTLIGTQSGTYITTGGNNLYAGYFSGLNNTTGANNTLLGYIAGQFIADGTTTATVIDNSILIGASTKVLANSQTNQIVIGYNQTGLGSNTTILGGVGNTTTAIVGNLLLGSTTDNGTDKLQVTGSAKVTGNITQSGANTSNLGYITNNASVGVYSNAPTTGNYAMIIGTVSNSGHTAIFTKGNNSGSTALRVTDQNIGASVNHLLVDYVGATGFGLANGTLIVNASAQVEIQSTTKGVLLPRMTTTQKLAISSPAEGLHVYDLTLHQMSYYNGTVWINF